MNQKHIHCLSLCTQILSNEGRKALGKTVLSSVESTLKKMHETASKQLPKAEPCLSTSLANSSGLEVRSPGVAKSPLASAQHPLPTSFWPEAEGLSAILSHPEAQWRASWRWCQGWWSSLAESSLSAHLWCPTKPSPAARMQVGPCVAGLHQWARR